MQGTVACSVRLALCRARLFSSRAGVVPNKALHRKNLPPLRYGNFSGELGR